MGITYDTNQPPLWKVYRLAAEAHASGRLPVQVWGLTGVVRFEDVGLHLVGHEEENVGRVSPVSDP